MDFYEDDYEDDMMDYEELMEEEMLDEDLGPVRPGMTVFNLYDECVMPTFLTAWPQLSWLFISCLMLMIFTKIAPRVKWCHLASSACGLLGLYSLIGTSMIYTVVFGVLTYKLVQACHRQVFYTVTYHWTMGVLFLYLVFREYVHVLPEAWEEVRGIQMIMVLKCLSVANEAAMPEKEVIPLFNYLGYLFCPATLVFGPWMPYQTYARLFEPKGWAFGWIVKVTATLLFSMISLTGSTCWIYWIFADFNWKWTRAARDALSFRLSHYFVAYTSEAMCLMSGFYSSSPGDSALNVSVVKPQKIEFPRSLVEVVCFWNQPMHQWLRQYIFKDLKKKCGLMTGFILTFLVSSLLHGLNFSLSMVLLSLGFYAYVEHQLREKLANIFSACVRSRSCEKCEHYHRHGSFGVITTNLCFGLLAYFHLVYLGVLMDSSRDAGSVFTTGVSEKLIPWQNLNFLSHGVVAATYMFFKVI